MSVTPPGPRGRSTMRDVAALAGVSFKTVSRVVNNESGVKPDLRAKVLDAIERLDYRTNLAASNLRRSGRTGMIGALVQDLSNSYSAALLRSIEDTARKHRTAVLAASLDEEREREHDLVHGFVTRRVDGLVIMPATDRQEYLASELRVGMPAVFVDRPPRGVDADSVTVDNLAGGRLATAHLLDHGHRRIAMLGDIPQIVTAHRRHLGYLDAYAARSLEPDPRLTVIGLRSSDDAQRAARQLLELDDPPTAIFAARNLLSVGAFRALAEVGREREIALVGFDDFPLADLLSPGLTVVRQDVARIGTTVAEMLFARIDGDTSPPQHVVFEPSLVSRGSGEIRPSAR